MRKHIVIASVRGENGEIQHIYCVDPAPPREEDMVTCSWCKTKFVEAHYPGIHSFALSFETGTTSDLFGPSTMGYEVENLCEACAWKLKDVLVGLGIDVKEFDI